jgi:hypothetical protein
MSQNSNRLPGEGLAQPTVPVTNPRERRMLLALLHRNLSREALDRAVGCSNTPDLVMRLRRRHNLDLLCSRESGIDRDGNPVKFGIYGASANDKRRIRDLLRGVR